MVQASTVEKVVRQLQRNQERQSEEDNYVSQIAKDADMDRDAVYNAIEWLDQRDLIERAPGHNRTIVRLRREPAIVNPSGAAAST